MIEQPSGLWLLLKIKVLISKSQSMAWMVPDIKNFLATTSDIEGTVAQSPIQMGRKVAQVIELMQEGKSYDSQYLIPVHLVNRDNISQYTVTGWQ